MSPAWRPLRDVDLSLVREARLQAHHAAQWLARAARAFVPPQPDDSHTNLGWDDALGSFATHPLGSDIRLMLRIADLTLLLAGAREAKGFAAKALHDKLLEVKDFDGVMGKLTMASDQSTRGPAFVIQIQAGHEEVRDRLEPEPVEKKKDESK